METRALVLAMLMSLEQAVVLLGKSCLSSSVGKALRCFLSKLNQASGYVCVKRTTTYPRTVTVA